MAVNFDKVAKRIWQILKSRGFSLEMFQDNGEYAYDPETEARRFYVKDEGIMVTVNEMGDQSEIKVYISDDHSLDDVEGLIKSINQAASYYGILVNVEKFGKRLLPRDFAFLAYKSKKEEEMNESIEVFNEAKDVTRLHGTSKSSVQNIGKPTKLIVRHTQSVDENKFAARSRHIDKIFVETHEGERLMFPINYLQGARAMARHMTEGGKWNDDLGKHIKETCKEMATLKSFSKNKPINESGYDVLESVRNRVSEIALEMKRLQGPMSYRKMAENFSPSDELNEESLSEEISRLAEMFPEVEETVLEMVSRVTYSPETLDEDDDPCWDGYEQYGMKKKNGKEVPNCVPKNEDVRKETAIQPIREFVEWAENFSLTEDDDGEDGEDGEDELVKDIADDPNLKNEIKDDPNLLNAYIKK